MADYSFKMCKSIFSNIKCRKSCSLSLDSVHGENDLTSHGLDRDFNDLTSHVLSKNFKSYRAIYTNVLAMVTTHAFCVPKAAILLCLVVIM